MASTRKFPTAKIVDPINDRGLAAQQKLVLALHLPRRAPSSAPVATLPAYPVAARPGPSASAVREHLILMGAGRGRAAEAVEPEKAPTLVLVPPSEFVPEKGEE